MVFEIWLGFAFASAALLVIPGPTVLLVCSYALGAGRRTALWTAAGVAAGDFAAMTASLLGLGALLSASSELFTALRWIGAVYLIYLGVRLWGAPTAVGSMDARAARGGPRMALHAFAVTATNPKSIAFFVAFAPQFIDAARPYAPQMWGMIATFVALAGVNAVLYAVAAGAMRARLRTPAALRAMNRLGSTALIGMGAATGLICLRR